MYFYYLRSVPPSSSERVECLQNVLMSSVSPITFLTDVMQGIVPGQPEAIRCVRGISSWGEGKYNIFELNLVVRE